MFAAFDEMKGRQIDHAASPSHIMRALAGSNIPSVFYDFKGVGTRTALSKNGELIETFRHA